MELRQAKQGEEKQVANLAVEVFKPNMKEQFIRLFHVDNVDHMFVGVDQGKVVAALNYYEADVVSSIGLLKTGSIGAVCTQKEYQGQGISTHLLSMAEKQMIKEHVDFCIISGRRGLYQRFGARDVGAIDKYQFIPDVINEHGFDIKPYQNDVETLYSIYMTERIYYVRSKDEFRDLLIGQTYPDSYQTYPIYLVYAEGKAQAYIIAIDHHEKKELGIKEFAGNRQWIAQALPSIMKMHGKESIELMTYGQDELKEYLGVKPVRMSQQATLKIMDKEGFFQKLNTWTIKKDLSIAFNKENDLNQVKVLNETYLLSDEALLFLVFSGTYTEDMKDETRYLLSKLCPIELPWSHNLNYQ